MNNVNVANMNAMAGGAPMPMGMNNANGPMAAAQQAAQRMDSTGNNHVMLNTYIYDYFLKEGLYDCARALLASDQPPNVNKGSPGSRRDENNNLLGNGVGDDAMDTDSKDDVDSKRPSDLPLPILTAQSDTCFLYEWFCLFWEVLVSQRKIGSGSNPQNPQVNQYIQHAQVNNLRVPPSPLSPKSPWRSTDSFAVLAPEPPEAEPSTGGPATGAAKWCHLGLQSRHDAYQHGYRE